MSDLTPELATKIVEACGANAEELAGAFGRALDGELVVKPGEPEAFDEAQLAGPGLAVVLAFGDQALAVALPNASGLLPDWVADPDPTGDSKLSTLAQELSMLVVPDDLMADDSRCVWVDDLASAVVTAKPTEGSRSVALELAKGEELATCRVIWPLADGAAIGAAGSESGDTAASSDPPAREDAETATPEPNDEDEPPTARVLRWNGPPPRDYRDLPPHVVSVLRVEVPVSVNLASKQVPIDDVINLGPGSIITFNKSCDGLLEIAAADRPIAEGEAVKVGEKFGVRVKQMILPEECFRPMLPPAAS